MPAHRSKLAVTTAFAFAAALVVAVPARPAHAQFGGLLKKAKEKAAEKVAEKAVDKAVDKAAGGDSASKANGGAATGAGAAAPSRGGRASRVLGRGDDASYAAGPAPTYSENLLEITPQRIDQLMKGLDAEGAYMEARAKGNDAASKKQSAEMKAYEAKHAAWEKKMADINARTTAYTNCSMANAGASGGMMPGAEKMQRKLASMSEAEQQAFMKRLQDLGQRGEAANKRGDRATAMAIMDTAYTLMGLTAEDRQQMAAAAAKAQANRKDCGPIPPEVSNPALMPAEPQPPQESNGGNAESEQDKVGAKASGLTVEQYGLLRERVAALVLYGGRPGRAWGFGENERKLVASRRNEFNKYEALLGGNAISWRFSGSDD
jgi:hypothetical protein